MTKFAVGCLPLPYRSTRGAHPGTGLSLDERWVVVAGEGTESAAEWFVRGVRDDLGLALETGEAQADPPAIVLRLGPVQAEWPPLPQGLAPSTGRPTEAATPTDERYSLRTASDTIAVEAASTAGIQRGVETLRQLVFDAGSSNAGIARPPILVPAGEIVDGPAYAWRGLCLDVARTFVTAGDLHRIVDLLALLHLNVLHLHLTDNEAWRMPVPARPLLTAPALGGTESSRPTPAYTVAELQEVVAHASGVGITVVPEIDLPGHLAAAVRAYPDIARRPELPALPPGVTPDVASYLDPDSPAARSFVEDVFAAVAEVFPAPLLHVGGDEAFAMPDDTYRDAIGLLHRTITSLGRRMICWQEASRAGLSSDTVGQHWLDTDVREEIAEVESGLPAGHPLAAMIQQARAHGLIEHFARNSDQARADLTRLRDAGNPVILSPQSAVYLDRPYADDPSRGAPPSPGLGHQLYPARPLRSVCEWDPGAQAAGARVAGVEAALWTESTSTFDDIVWLLLPRLAQGAESAWTGRPGVWDDQRRRLQLRERQWEHLGLVGFPVPADTDVPTDTDGDGPGTRPHPR